METGAIKEEGGVFSSVLDFRPAALLGKLLDPAAPYVLCWGHTVGNYTWQPFTLPLIKPERATDTISRVVHFDFVQPTAEFLDLLPQLGPSVNAVQLHSLPPGFLDMS